MGCVGSGGGVDQGELCGGAHRVEQGPRAAPLLCFGRRPLARRPHVVITPWAACNASAAKPRNLGDDNQTQQRADGRFLTRGCRGGDRPWHRRRRLCERGRPRRPPPRPPPRSNEVAGSAGGRAPAAAAAAASAMRRPLLSRGGHRPGRRRPPPRTEAAAASAGGGGRSRQAGGRRRRRPPTGKEGGRRLPNSAAPPVV